NAPTKTKQVLNQKHTHTHTIFLPKIPSLTSSQNRRRPNGKYRPLSAHFSPSSLLLLPHPPHVLVLLLVLQLRVRRGRRFRPTQAPPHRLASSPTPPRPLALQHQKRSLAIPHPPTGKKLTPPRWRNALGRGVFVGSSSFHDLLSILLPRTVVSSLEPVMIRTTTINNPSYVSTME
uniref:Uncharacterized protein n=1 Tax=Cucumis melo TaxID=3656 RepID=A0A9I9DUR4_CUCME